jgi:hypothetical protein
MIGRTPVNVISKTVLQFRAEKSLRKCRRNGSLRGR